MINKVDILKYYIKEDAQANKIQSWIDYRIKLMYGNVNACVFRYLKVLRKYEYYSKNKKILRYYYRFLHRRYGLKYNLAIPINKVGFGLYIPHIEGGVIVNCEKIGNHCTINSGVVVGNKGDNSKVPTIGNNVTLSVGCKIIGNIIIGNNVLIAPNAVVVKDVPDNCVVAGVPARIIKKDGIKVNNR